MGFGGRGGRGEASRSDDEGGSKERKKVKLSADDVLRIVAQHRKQVSNNPNWKKMPRLLDKFSKEQLKALSFIKGLKYLTDSNLIASYEAAEVERRKWFDKNPDWSFEANVDSGKLEVLSYMTPVDIHGETTELADWQVKPHCRPSEVANGPWADAAGSMRRGWPRPRGVAEIVYGNRGVFDK